MNDYHVYPLNDKREHILVGSECQCKPEIELVGATLIIIHNSYDFREIAEALKKLEAKDEMSELKPCPFCGSEEVTPGFMGDWFKPNFIYCHNCYAETSKHENKDDVIDKWNTRPIEDALQAKLNILCENIYDIQRDLERSLSSREKVDYEIYISDAIEMIDEALKKLKGE